MSNADGPSNHSISLRPLFKKMLNTSQTSTSQLGTKTPHEQSSLLGQSAEIRQAIFIYALRDETGPIRLHTYERRLYQPNQHSSIDFTSFDQGKIQLLQHPLFHLGHRQLYNEALEALVLANDFHSRSSVASLFLHHFLTSLNRIEASNNPMENHNRGVSGGRTYKSDMMLKDYYREMSMPIHASPSTTGLSWIRSLTFSNFHEEEENPSFQTGLQALGHMALVKACPGINTLTIAIDKEQYYDFTTDPINTHSWYAKPPTNGPAVVSALGWKSIAKACRERTSLKTLVFDLRLEHCGHQSLGKHVLPHFGAETIPFAKSWFKEQGLTDLQVVGKLLGKDWGGVGQMYGSRTAVPVRTLEDELERMVGLLLKENI